MYGLVGLRSNWGQTKWALDGPDTVDWWDCAAMSSGDWGGEGHGFWGKGACISPNRCLCERGADASTAYLNFASEQRAEQALGNLA